jgi:hypothetical protein
LLRQCSAKLLQVLSRQARQDRYAAATAQTDELLAVAEEKKRRGVIYLAGVFERFITSASAAFG